jgi:hypothetical protein
MVYVRQGKIKLCKLEFIMDQYDWRWLRHYATNRKVAGSSPDEVDLFQLT